MKFFLTVLTLIAATSAWAYQDGTYQCKNSNEGYPNDIYKLQTVKLGSVSLPYLEILRTTKNESGPSKVEIQGLASRFVVDGNEILTLNGIQLEIKDGRIHGCD